MIINKKISIPLTGEENYRHYNKKVCLLCKKPFLEDNKNNYIKVRDHDHFTGKYRDAAHKVCNFLYNTPKEIRTIFHNSSNYDYHFIIEALHKNLMEILNVYGRINENI